jgi:hypothetical protein
MFTKLWYTLFKRSIPWADVKFLDGKMVVAAYNKAFVDDLRHKHGDLIDEKTTDDEIVGLFTAREDLRREKPKMTVIHSGIDEDGLVKLELDWNSAFITHLREQGVVAETEDEAIQQYLQLITNQELMDETTGEIFEEAFAEINEETRKEMAEAEAIANDVRAYEHSNGMPGRKVARRRTTKTIQSN